MAGRVVALNTSPYEAVKALTDAATVAVDVAYGRTFTLSTSSSRTIGAPTNIGAAMGASGIGMVITFEITRTSAGAITTTWNAVFSLAGTWTDPTAQNKARTITFWWNGTNWRERSRTEADI